jgi:putative salt-induced outer membrane protein
MKRIAVVLLFAVHVLSSSWLLAEDKPKKNWTNIGELSLVSTNGNTKSNTWSAKDTYGYTWTHTVLELVAGGLGAESNGVATAENYYAHEKVSYKLSDRNYTFEKIGWEKNRFAGLNERYDGNVGLGRELISKPNDKLIGEFGAGYTREDRISVPNNDFASLRAYSKYTRTISATSNFTQDAEYIQNLDNNDDFRANTETAITAALSTHFSLKVSYVWKYVGEPPTGFGRSDTTTSVALIVNY